MDFTPPPPVPQRGVRATFAPRLDAFNTWLAGLIPQLQAFLARLEVIAFGGAYAIPFTFSGNLANAGNSGYFVSPGNGYLYFNDTDGGGASTLARLTEVFSSTSANRAYILLTSRNDPSRWVSYYANTAYVHGAGNGNVGAVYFAQNGNIVEGEPVIVSIQRTGDKGDNGTSISPILWIRDEKPSGTGGGTNINGWNVRTLNTVVRNTIGAGASLSANRFTLPPGTYRLTGSVPVQGVGAFQAFIYNAGDGTRSLSGTSEFAGTSASSRSLLQWDFTIGLPTTFELRQFSGTASGSLGAAAGTGVNEVYSEIFIEKLA